MPNLNEFSCARNLNATRPVTLDITETNPDGASATVAVSSCKAYDSAGTDVTATYLTGSSAVAADKLSINTPSFTGITSGLHISVELIYTVGSAPHVATWFVFFSRRLVEAD